MFVKNSVLLGSIVSKTGLSIVPLKYFEFFEDQNDAFNYIWFEERKLS